MGFYERRIFPWLNDKLTKDPELLQLRGDVLAGARGCVLEIGFGTGANLSYYPAAVESLVAIEPNVGMRDRAAAPVRASKIAVEMLAASAEQLPVPDETVDTAVSTLTLCSVADPDRALEELRRVLRPGGRLLILEHGLADDAAVARWQRRLNPIQRVVAGGSDLKRPLADLVQRHGCLFENVNRF